MDICVIGGAGHVGLVTSLGLAEIGHSVISVDADEDRIRDLRSGIAPFWEEGLNRLLVDLLERRWLRFTSNLTDGVVSSDVVFVAVGTPSGPQGKADISQVIHVIEGIAEALDKYKTVVIKSTVPVGTVELVQDVLTRRSAAAFDIVANPEFLREGQALHDFFHPERIVIGASSDRAREVMRAVYAPIIRRQVSWPREDRSMASREPIPVVEATPVSALMIKYASNSFLATRVSFINEVAKLCELTGADIQEVAHGMGYDSRIGASYLQAGLGFGGPCLEKDVRALLKLGQNHDYKSKLLEAVLARNDAQMADMMVKLEGLVGSPLKGRVVTVFGLAFKAGTSDVRNSSALRVIGELETREALVRAYDPAAISEARIVNPHICGFDDPYEAVQDSDVLAILTDWPDFKTLDYHRVRSLMATPKILDARNLLDALELRELGFTYVGFGRP